MTGDCGQVFFAVLPPTLARARRRPRRPAETAAGAGAHPRVERHRKRIGDRRSDDNCCEDQLEGDSPQEQSVREEARFAERGLLGAGGKSRPDLTGDDPEECHRRRLEVGVVERRAPSVASPGDQPARRRT